MTPSSDRLLEFHTVVREGSISRAARVLVLPRATLSRRIKGLERDLGVQLLHRSSRPLKLTSAGEALMARADRIISDTRTAWEEVRAVDGVPRGLLRISLPPSAPVLHDYIVEFMHKYPEIEMVISVDARHLDLAAGGIDLAIRVGPPSSKHLIAQEVWRSQMWAVAATDYLDRCGNPASAEDLANHRCITMFDGSGVRSTVWPLTTGGTIEVPDQLVLGDIALLKKAVLSGIGIALVSEARMRPELGAGQVVKVLPEVIGSEAIAYAVYLDREYLPTQLQLFIEGLKTHMAKADRSQPG